MAELTIEQQIRLLAAHIDRIGKMMCGVSELHTLRGKELQASGAIINQWADELEMESSDELDTSISEADETVREETEDQVAESVEAKSLSNL